MGVRVFGIRVFGIRVFGIRVFGILVFGIYLLGAMDLSFFMPPFGVENAGLVPLFVMGVVTVGTKFDITIPNNPKLLGVRIGVQALTLASTKPGTGQFGNLIDRTIK